MGQPNHYSQELTERCQFLIERLLPIVRHGLKGDETFRGPVTTTFLSAMATPMIVLPVERLFKAESLDNPAGHDAELDETLTKEVRRTLGLRFDKTPFGKLGGWSFLQVRTPFSISGDWPPEILLNLNSPSALDSAAASPASRILCNLRNALAHGGVVYLDEYAQHSERPAAIFAFVSSLKKAETVCDGKSHGEGKGNCDGKSINRLVGWNILRVHETVFIDFLATWSDWLAKSHVSKILGKRVSVAA